MNLAVRSLYLIGDRVEFTEDEAQARARAIVAQGRGPTPLILQDGQRVFSTRNRVPPKRREDATSEVHSSRGERRA